MWTREDLKTKAKAAFKGNYGNSVGAYIIIGLLLAVLGGLITYYTNLSSSEGSSSPVAYVALVIVAVLEVLVINPVAAGLDYFYLKNSNGEKPTVSDAFYFFREGRFSNAVGVLFLKELFLSLWTILLIVPGVIKSYEYRMINYILAENPDMSWKEVFAKSKEMMNGQKMNAFVLDLSFIGWDLLGIVTLGLAGVLYVGPYQEATNAELYKALKK